MKETNAAVPGAQTVSIAQPRRQHSGRTMPLSMVRPDEKVRIRSISGKDDTRRFLNNMGFVEDAEISVITEMSGNVIVNIKGTRVAISRAMASRVLTVPQKAEGEGKQ